MEVKLKGIELLLTPDEATALTKLLGNMSRTDMMEQGDVDLEEANLLQVMYGTLSTFVPNQEAA